MSAPLPPRTRAEQVAYNAEVMRQQVLVQPNVRLSRRRRRIAVVITYTLLMVIFVTLGVKSSAATFRSPFPLVWFGGLAVLSICLLVIDYAVGGLTRKNSMLDERERAERDHATALAYSTLTGLVAVATFYTIVASLSRQWWLPLPSTVLQLLPLGVGLIWLVTTLPKAILAWTLPDPDPASMS